VTLLTREFPFRANYFVSSPTSLPSRHPSQTTEKVLSRSSPASPSEDDHVPSNFCPVSKADLVERDLYAQLTEVTCPLCHVPFRALKVFVSFPPSPNRRLPVRSVHSNIVTSHRTLATSTFLLLLLEFVPGQDLFYFLGQVRDHYAIDFLAVDPALTCTLSLGLLSSLHLSLLLSHTRLHLIASMFAQMCEAVATCHDASAFHRDIEPENFIVTDGWSFNQDGIRERKVVVKLSDFGLSTREAASSDVDCGSAPYMSYSSLSSFIYLPIFTLSSPECRNNVSLWLRVAPGLRSSRFAYALSLQPLCGHGQDWLLLF
jgi:Protein kinase domain